jgi:hypothetical protein
MRAFKLASAGVVAILAIAVSGQQASAQEYYGYQGSGQAPMPSGQGPGPGCHVERIGCHVIPCPCPCHPGAACHEINQKLPPIKPVPTCHEADVCVVVSELAPDIHHVTIPIWRNCYVPIRVEEKKPQPVTVPTFQVNWREIHVLCGPDGKPYTSEQTTALLKELQEQLAAQAPQAPGAAAAPAPAAPTAPVAAAAPTPAKRWVWLAGQNVWGYGYKRADGLWVIDQGSKRPTPPEEVTNPTSAENTNAPTTTKS